MSRVGEHRRYTNVVHSNGKTYVTTSEMTRIFVKRALALADEGHTELVPLPHREGLEMVLVGPDTLLMVSAVDLDENGRSSALLSRSDEEPETVAPGRQSQVA